MGATSLRQVDAVSLFAQLQAIARHVDSLPPVNPLEPMTFNRQRVGSQVAIVLNAVPVGRNRACSSNALVSNLRSAVPPAHVHAVLGKLGKRGSVQVIRKEKSFNLYYRTEG